MPLLGPGIGGICRRVCYGWGFSESREIYIPSLIRINSWVSQGFIRITDQPGTLHRVDSSVRCEGLEIQRMPCQNCQPDKKRPRRQYANRKSFPNRQCGMVRYQEAQSQNVEDTTANSENPTNDIGHGESHPPFINKTITLTMSIIKHSVSNRQWAWKAK